MKTEIIKNYTQRLAIVMFSVFFGVLSYAQESGSAPDTNVKVTTTGTTTTTEEWYSNPIYWVIGGLLFIILIAVIVRGNSQKN